MSTSSRGYRITLADAKGHQETWEIAPASSAPSALRDALAEYAGTGEPSRITIDSYDLPRKVKVNGRTGAPLADEPKAMEKAGGDAG